MGNCVSKEDNQIYDDEDSFQRGTFIVTNLDNQKLAHKGMMVVTAMELVYIDENTKKVWEWPFMLRVTSSRSKLVGSVHMVKGHTLFCVKKQKLCTTWSTRI